jgi:methionyl-tRNA formyltransferase
VSAGLVRSPLHCGLRLEIVAAAVSEAVYGRTPGRILYCEADGVAVVVGADARRGKNKHF